MQWWVFLLLELGLRLWVRLWFVGFHIVEYCAFSGCSLSVTIGD